MQKKVNAIVFPPCIIKLYLHVIKHHIFLLEIKGKMTQQSVGIDGADFWENGENEFSYV